MLLFYHVAIYSYYDLFGSAPMYCLLVFCMCTEAHLIFVNLSSENSIDIKAHL